MRSTQLVDTLAPADQKLLEAKARTLLAGLRGEDRETLARVLENRGAVESVRRRCRSRRAGARAGACRLLGDAGSPFSIWCRSSMTATPMFDALPRGLWAASDSPPRWRP